MGNIIVARGLVVVDSPIRLDFRPWYLRENSDGVRLAGGTRNLIRLLSLTAPGAAWFDPVTLAFDLKFARPSLGNAVEDFLRHDDFALVRAIPITAPDPFAVLPYNARLRCVER